jgi:hypothetical protein
VRSGGLAPLVNPNIIVCWPVLARIALSQAACVVTVQALQEAVRRLPPRLHALAARSSRAQVCDGGRRDHAGLQPAVPGVCRALRAVCAPHPLCCSGRT